MMSKAPHRLRERGFSVLRQYVSHGFDRTYGACVPVANDIALTQPSVPRRPCPSCKRLPPGRFRIAWGCGEVSSRREAMPACWSHGFDRLPLVELRTQPSRAETRDERWRRGSIVVPDGAKLGVHLSLFPLRQSCVHGHEHREHHQRHRRWPL